MSAPERQRPVDLDAPGPRTYQASFALTDGRPTLMTAEEWLREEADIWSAMAFDDDTSDEPNRAGTLRAIAREVETIRRERSQWAASHTALTTQLRELEAANARLTADAARDLAMQLAINARGPLVIWTNENGLAFAWARIPEEDEQGDGADFDTFADLIDAVIDTPAPGPSESDPMALDPDYPPCAECGEPAPAHPWVNEQQDHVCPGSLVTALTFYRASLASEADVPFPSDPVKAAAWLWRERAASLGLTEDELRRRMTDEKNTEASDADA